MGFGVGLAGPPMAACWVCGTSPSRISQLESENAALKARLAELDGTRRSKQPSHSELSTRTSFGSFHSSSSPSPVMPELAIQRSPRLHHAVRGYTAAGLAEAEADEESQHGKLEVTVGDAPRQCHDAIGSCTIVQIRTRDRPGLLANLSTVLAGVDLSIARALFHTSELGIVSNEFWVQQTNSDGRLGPVLEGVKRRAIEQRVRQWSAGQRLDVIAPSLPFGEWLASGDLSDLLRLPGFHSATELPHHRDDDGPNARGFIGALTAALSTDCSWTGALPPVLARQTATALLPRMLRMRLAAGCSIRRNRHDQLGTDFLLLLEDALPVMCGLTSDDEGASTAPISLDESTPVMHPEGSVLCLSSSVEAKGRQLAWHSLNAPSGGVVCVVGRATLRELLGETRKAAVRRHAKQLASAPYLAPLGTPQLLALCHRAVEVEAMPGSSVDTLSAGSPAVGRQPSAVAGVAVNAAADSLIQRAGGPSPAFMIVLRGSAVVTYAPSATSAAAGASALREGRLPIHRLRPNDHYGALGVLGNCVEAELELYAGEEGCTLLSWTSDECACTAEHTRLPRRLEAALGATIWRLAASSSAASSSAASSAASHALTNVIDSRVPPVLQRELRKLPELLVTSWASRAPLALALSMPRILTLLEPTSFDQVCARAAEQRGGDRAAAGVIAPKAALCVLLHGTLYEEAAVAVAIEAPTPADELASAPLSTRTSFEEGRPARDDAAHSRRLVVRVELPTACGTKLTEIARLLDELQLDVTSGSVATNGKVARDTFHVHYRGTLSSEALAATLRAKLHATLQLSVLLPGDSIEASRTRPFTIHTSACGADVPSATAAASGAVRQMKDIFPTLDDALLARLLDSCDGDLPSAVAAATDLVEGSASSPPTPPPAAIAHERASEVTEVRLGLLDLRTLGAMVASPDHPDCELWLRYLQVRAPDLLLSLATATPAAAMPTRRPAVPTAEQWLSALRGFMLLRWRKIIGGPQLLDGVQMGDLQFGPMLGEGAYGQVFLARHRMLPDRWYAVKRQQLDTSQRGKQQLRYLEREREVLLLLARESRGKADINLFVQLVTHGQDTAWLQLAMTAVLGGELFHLLEETGALTEPEVQFYAANLVMALQHLHSRGIAYRDLKSENVLLSGGFTHAAAGWPVLADFGLANWLKNDGSSLQTFCGTPAFIAPEVAAQNGHGAAADWWALGCLIFQCLTLCTPFEGPTAHATIENIIHGRRVPPARLSDLSETAAGIIDALLHPDPAERLGGPLRANEVLTNPFFWGFDFTQIEKRQMTPPHAARCRERAIAATQHPSLRLPPLPNLDNLANSAVESGQAQDELVMTSPHAAPGAKTTLELDQMERGPAGV